MSRAKKNIPLGNINCTFINNESLNSNDNNGLRYLKFESKDKSLIVPLPKEVNPEIQGKDLLIKSDNKAVEGTVWQICVNAIHGLEKGFKKLIILRGNGFKAAVNNRVLELSLGYSHSISYNIPDSVEIKVNPTAAVKGDCELVVTSIDKCILGRVAMELYNMRRPDPYKGKGVILPGKYILRKKGKSGAKGKK